MRSDTYRFRHSVVPHAGTWIEITCLEAEYRLRLSFPTRERGLKLRFNDAKIATMIVVPHAGTWIEIFTIPYIMNKYLVVPHAGTWIEIAQEIDLPEQKTVVPHAGTWIEIDREPASA